MPDICTLIFTTTLLYTPCVNPQQSCGTTMDGTKKICTSYCPSPPQQYSCTKETGESYIWEPKLGEGIIGYAN